MSQLDLLPKEVIAKWKSRVEDFAIKQAESVVHLDPTGTVQKCITAIYLYRAGIIIQEDLHNAIEACNGLRLSRDGTSSSAVHAAASAALAIVHRPAANTVIYTLTATAYSATPTQKFDSGAVEVKFYNWLLEELYRYNQEEIYEPDRLFQ